MQEAVFRRPKMVEVASRCGARRSSRQACRAVDNPDDEVVADFRERWQSKYDDEPGSIDFYALSFYDPVIMLAEAMQAAGTIEDPAAVGAEMSGVTDWPEKVLPFESQMLNLLYRFHMVNSAKNVLAHTHTQGAGKLLALNDGVHSLADEKILRLLV